MNERSRNRLVGAVILIALAAIFLPMLFDGAGIERRQVPVMPSTEGIQADAVEPLDPAAEDWAFLAETERRRQDPMVGDVMGVPRHEALDAEDAEDADQAPGPALAEDGTPRAWSVQLASFATLENANKLRDELLADGYESYVSELSDADRVLYRVAVGPRLDLGAVRRLRDDLEVRYRLEGMVVRFHIERSGTES